jgi:GTP-binding protein LepA
VDFSYEVSRALAAVEGAVLLVDATQGIQAQTLAHFTLAQRSGLVIIPVVNKIDLPNADVPSAIAELMALLGCAEKDIFTISAKTGAGVPELLDGILKRIPPPKGDINAHSRALVFDAVFDDYRGVIAYLRCVDGSIEENAPIELLGTHARSIALECGTFSPGFQRTGRIDAGEIGYCVTGLKSIAQCRVGDTITHVGADVKPLPGYEEPLAMVYASMFPQEGEDANTLRTALEKLQLNDAAIRYEGERSPTFGLGFRCGFLGLFHLEITQERLRREHGLTPIITLPSVAYRVTMHDGTSRFIRSAQHLPDPSTLTTIEEPWASVSCVLPDAHYGAVMQMIHEHRGFVTQTESLGHGADRAGRLLVNAELPLTDVITRLYDQLKSRTSGFASMYYAFREFRPARIVKLDILIAGERAEELSTLVIEKDAARIGRRTLETLKESIPREQFEIRLQAAVGGRILAAERIPPLRKDVTAKLYGGDVTRKRKLLEKQKKGKQRMRERGRVVLPPEAYLAVLKKDSRSVQ